MLKRTVFPVCCTLWNMAIKQHRCQVYWCSLEQCV